MLTSARSSRRGDKTLAPLCRCVRGCDACDCVCVCVGRAALTAVNGRVTQASVSDYVRNWTERSIMNTFLCIKQTAATHSAPFHILQQNQTEANKNRTPCPALSTQLRDIGEKEKKTNQKKNQRNGIFSIYCAGPTKTRLQNTCKRIILTEMFTEHKHLYFIKIRKIFFCLVLAFHAHGKTHFSVTKG